MERKGEQDTNMTFYDADIKNKFELCYHLRRVPDKMCFHGGFVSVNLSHRCLSPFVLNGATVL